MDNENEQIICVHWSQECTYIDNDPEQEEWYEYCFKKHCEINNEDCPSCKDCLQYDDDNE